MIFCIWEDANVWACQNHFFCIHLYWGQSCFLYCSFPNGHVSHPPYLPSTTGEKIADGFVSPGLIYLHLEEACFPVDHRAEIFHFTSPSIRNLSDLLQIYYLWASLVAQMVSCNAGDPGSNPGEDPLEEGMATHSSILVWRIPWTKEPGRLQSVGSQRVRHNWATNTFPFTAICRRENRFRPILLTVACVPTILATSSSGALKWSWFIPDPGMKPPGLFHKTAANLGNHSVPMSV